MCISCGCVAPDDIRGDGRQISASHLKAAAQANDLTLIQVAENILSYAKDVPQADQRPKVEPAVPTDADVAAREG
jgi:hypothetical protein